MLAEVLAEPMLSTVQRQADTTAANGWFWTYQLDGVKVRCNLVECSPQGQLQSWHANCTVGANAIARNGQSKTVVRVTFSCRHCTWTQVEAVQPAPPDDAGEGATHGHAAVVTARLHETADVWNDQGKKGDSYTSTYKVGPLGVSLQCPRSV